MAPERPTLGLPSFRLYLFGSFSLERDGTRLQLYSRKAEALLSYLALYPQEHPREKLAALFWGDSTNEHARHSLRMALSSIRKQMTDVSVLSDRDSVQLNPEFPLWVDARDISDIPSVLPDLDVHVIEHLKSSIKNYRGDLLTDFYDDWVAPLREEFRERYLNALLKLVEYFRTQGEYREAVKWAQEILATDRANEQAHQHLMFCYTAAGNRTAALQQYQDCKLALRDELGIDPSDETRTLYESIRRQGAPPSPAARLTNLPRPTTSFLGREREIQELGDRLSRNGVSDSLVVLVGAGGSGKTRLAIEVGRTLGDEYADGVWWADLSTLTNPALVPQQVAKTLGLTEHPNVSMEQALVKHLRPRELLLLLDNCEHLKEACARLVARVLDACPRVAILATSREPLGAQGETVYPVPTLSVPPRVADLTPQITDPSDLLKYEGIRLFVERARTQQPAFRLSAQNAPLVVRVCQTLDGIPLALELAAAAIRDIGLDDLARRLEPLLQLRDATRQTSRQRSLHAVMDWSYDLLDPVGRSLFGRLTVFAGGWTLEQATVVAGGYTDLGANGLPNPAVKQAALLPVTASFVMRALLDDLVSKSLILFEPSPTPRYRFLETIRDYARERLEEQDAAAAIRERHLAYFTALAEEAYRPNWKSQDPELLARLETEHDNLRAALEYGLATGNVDMTLRLAGALGTFWYHKGYARQGDNWYRRVLESAQGRGAPEIRARVLSSAGTLKWSLSEFLLSKELHQQALDAYRAANDLAGIAFSLNNIYLQDQLLGEREVGVEPLGQALALAQQSADAELEIVLLNSLATYFIETKPEPMRAKTLFERALDLARQTKGPDHALVASNLGEFESRLGNHARALVYLDEALLHVERTRNPLIMGVVEREKGVALDALGDTQAARLWLQRSLQTFRKNDMQFEYCSSLAHLAKLEADTGNLGHAAVLAAYVQKQIKERLGTWLHLTDQTWFEPLVTQLREKLGDVAFERAWAKGRAMTPEQIATLALREPSL